METGLASGATHSRRGSTPRASSSHTGFEDEDDDDSQSEIGGSQGTEEEEDEDEWENDRDCGYVGFSVSEEEFLAMEEEALEAAHRQMVLARARKQVKREEKGEGCTWGAEGEGEDGDGDDEAGIEEDLLAVSRNPRARTSVHLDHVRGL